MRSFKTEGIVIKRRNFGEADRILTVFGKHSGKIQIKAGGVRRITSRRSGHIELLNHSMLSLYKGKSLPILTEAQTVDDFSSIKNNLTKIGFAYHICELIDGLCAENQENRDIFFLLKNTLDKLSKEDEIVFIIHEFEIELLTLLGFWPRNRPAQNLNTSVFIERILERKLKTKPLLSRLQ
ncbi:MAG: DNA repair protein RecO [Candidatus Levybacteria bacterium]|nr:DNA repair protein RecO [Candidatus Levybacteria bacterium]